MALNSTYNQQAAQDKYTSVVKEVYEHSEGNLLKNYLQKETSKGKDRSIFYKYNKLTARVKTSNFNATSGSPDDVSTVVDGQLLESVVAKPFRVECPVWQDRDEFDLTSLDIKSPLVNAQMDSIREQEALEILGKLKSICVTDDYTREDKAGNSAGVSLPAANVFGDGLVAWETAANIKAFRKMMARAKMLGKNGKYPAAIIGGVDFLADLMSSSKFTSKDWTSTTTKDGINIDRLLGAELISFNEFDSEFYPLGTETVGYAIVVLKDAIGHSSWGDTIESDITYVNHKKHWFYDTELSMVCEIIDEAGIMVFKYLK